MRTTHTNTSTRRLAALLAAAGIAGSAAAQVRWAEPPPAPSAPAASPGGSTTRTVVRSNDDRTTIMSGTAASGDRYEIKIKNGVVDAKLNGKPVPDDRIRRAGDTIQIIDEDGNAVAVVSNADDAVVFGNQVATIAPGFIQPDGQGAVTFATTAAEDPPKVMVGINMSNVDPTLREHFGLDEDAGFVVDNVVDGLPADKAGIKARDIVISIDGKNVTNATLRDALKSREPGQVVKVKILRKGETREVEMKLEAYDASRLGLSVTPPSMGFLSDVPIQSFSFGREMSDEEREEVQRAMQEAQRAMEEAMGQMRGNQAEAMEQAREQMRRAMEELRRSEQNMRFRIDRDGGISNLYVVPTPPAAPAAPGEPSAPQPAERRYQVLRNSVGQPGAERMSQIESRLDELNARLDRLDDRIGKLLDRLERDN